MANRNLDFSPDVMNVVAEQPSDMASAIAGVGANLAQDSAKAKMLAANAQLQTEFKQLDAQFRLKYADDPTNEDGMKELGELRQTAIAKYGDGIPLLFQRQWNQQSGDLALQSSLSNEVWGAEQMRVNTVKNINDSINTYLSSASVDGMAFGQDNKAVLSGSMNFLDARGRLEQTGAPIIGEQKTRELLSNFDSDYVKTFVAGVVETNPQKAIDLMDQPEIRDSFTKPEDYFKFKAATEQRARAVYKNERDGGALRTMNSSNQVLAQGGKMNWTQLQTADLTEEARTYFEGLNGFRGTGKRGGFTPEDKAGYELAIYDAVANLQKDKDMDPQSVRVVQDAIYRGMNVGAITQAQGQNYISQIVQPLIAKKEEAMSQYSDDSWLSDDVGFGGIQEFYDKNVHRATDGMAKGDATAIEASNKVNKANLYDYYMGAIQARANAAGVPVGDIQRLPKTQRNKIYSEAQSEAQTMFLRDKHPALRTMPDVPNFVYSNGKLIQGAAGPRNVTADKTATPTFKLQKDTDTGDIYRVYSNGQKELVNKGAK